MMNIAEIDWARVLREIKDIYNINIKDIAEKIDVTKQVLSLYKSGKRKPKYETVVKFSKEFPDFPWEQVFHGGRYKKESKNAIQKISSAGKIIDQLSILTLEELELIQWSIDYFKNKIKEDGI